MELAAVQTTGAACCRTLTSSYYRGAQGIIFGAQPHAETLKGAIVHDVDISASQPLQWSFQCVLLLTVIN
jgi:hypothetical protein